MDIFVHRKTVLLDKERIVTSYPESIKNRIDRANLVLQAKAYPKLHPSVYSFIKGKGTHLAIDQLKRFFRKYRSLHKSPKTRGLFCLKFDIRRYGESIDTKRGAPLWEVLRNVLAPDTALSSKLERELLPLLNPRVHPDSPDQSTPMGLPMGVNITNTLENIFLLEFDHSVAPLCAFYARYCDDVMLIFHNLEQMLDTERLVLQRLEQLGLSMHPDKIERIYLTGCGKAYHEPSVAVQGRSYVTFLGCDVFLLGGSRPKHKRMLALKDEVSRRLKMYARAVKGRPFDDMLDDLTQILAESISKDASWFTDDIAGAMRVFDHRASMKEFDHWVYQTFAAIVTGKPVSGASPHLSAPRLSRAKFFRKVGPKLLLNQRNAKSKSGGKTP